VELAHNPRPFTFKQSTRSRKNLDFCAFDITLDELRGPVALRVIVERHSVNFHALGVRFVYYVAQTAIR
jgi:hypothetical protein